jgi:hypothetical protein
MRQWVNPSFLINERIEGFHVSFIYASHASFKYLAGNRNESNQNHYLSDDSEIVADVPADVACTHHYKHKQNLHIILSLRWLA